MTTLTAAVAQHLSMGPYRFQDDAWEYQYDGAWSASIPLDGYNYEEGVAVIAACPWASLAEDEHQGACAHTALETLGPSQGDACDDHETQSVRCYGCTGLFLATIWRTDRETELRPMTTTEAKRYEAWGL